MCSTTHLILHLARNIISCPLHISALLLYLEGSKKTLDLTPCLLIRQGVLHSTLGQWEAHLHAPLWLLFSTAYPLRQRLLAFRVLSFPDGCNQLGPRSLFFMRSQLSLPEFFLLVSMPACALPMGRFNGNANQTLSRLSKILISILIQSEIRHIFKSQQHLQVICAEWKQRCGFLHRPKKISFSLFEIYSPTSKNIQDYYAHFISFHLNAKSDLG